MSKGTKQIRLGRVERFVKGLEIRLQSLEDARKRFNGKNEVMDEGLLVRVDELKRVIGSIRHEFELGGE